MASIRRRHLDFLRYFTGSNVKSGAFPDVSYVRQQLLQRNMMKQFPIK